MASFFYSTTGVWSTVLRGITLENKLWSEHITHMASFVYSTTGIQKHVWSTVLRGITLECNFFSEYPSITIEPGICVLK